MRGVHGVGARSHSRNRGLERGAVLPRHFLSFVVRTLVDNQDLVAGAQGIENATEAQGVIVGLEQSADFRHTFFLAKVSQ